MEFLSTEVLVVVGAYYLLNALVESLPDPKEMQSVGGKFLVRFLNALAGNFRKGLTEKFPQLKGK
ncbi:MAG: hypothetical protein J3T61_09400 [Candidatus Brocadiales bacterium]|nr:hypothetical protein [Candidatus Bathyanammoxibius sp.]